MKSLNKVLGLGVILLTIFCVSFFFFYKSAKGSLQPQHLILTSKVINQPLPKARLVNISGEQLGDEKLRRGKVVLLFTTTDCRYCDDENNFLKTVAGSRKDVSYYYVIPFGMKEQMLQEAQRKYAFETFYDEGSTLSRTLQVYQVPLQVYLEDGVIKKTWVDSIAYSHSEDEYKRWLSSL
jgi:peroxiredoxin